MAKKTPTMLRRLRLQFVVITMALVGAVLGVSFATSFISTRNTQISQTDSSLHRVLEDDRSSRWNRIDWRDPFGEMEETEEPELDAEENERLLRDAAVIKVFITNSGLIVDGNEAYEDASTNSDFADIVNAIMEQEGDEGTLEDIHISWVREELEGWGHVVAFTDTTQRDEAIKSQAINTSLIYLAAMLAVFAASWWLSTWALKPVEDAWDRQRRFIADASHELKTPLAVILANSQILQNDSSISNASMRWVDSTEEEATHMNELVTELLELARADEASVAGSSSVMALADVDFSELVEAATLEFDAVAFERGCSIESAIEPNITLKGDRTWLERAVKGLIDNATKYADNGTAVKVSLKREGKHVVYAVNNQGVVISAEELNHIFDRFYRSDRARSRSDTGGFGLGLAIAKSIFEAHGGKITATSNNLEGTTFTVTL